MVSLPCITKEKWIIRIKHHILLPLLQDETHSVATIKHALQKIRETVRFLNPGQIPVVTADQPLYSLAKQIQQKIGQSTKRIRLSCEMAALKSIGTLLHDSGWTSALVEASIASSILDHHSGHFLKMAADVFIIGFVRGPFLWKQVMFKITTTKKCIKKWK